MAQFHPLKIRKIEHQTEEAVVLTFEVPSDLAEHYHYIPGQHLTLKAQIAEEEVRRCYSICSPSESGCLQVAIKAIPQGRFSNYLKQQIQDGDTLEVMTPQGQFGYQPRADQQGRYLAIAAGSGITPILSILASTLAQEPNSTFTLLYGNRNTHSMMFRQALADLKDRYTSRLQLVYLMSQEQVESPLLSGRIDAEHLKKLGKHLIPWREFDQIFLCGPESMMDETYAALLAEDVEPGRLHRERFLVQASARRTLARNAEEVHQVAVRLDGREFTVQVTAQDDSILDAALRQGADLPYACKGGVCATCKCRLLQGEVAMGTNYSLEQDQLDKGFILSCQSLPVGQDVFVDFDQ